MATKNDKTPEQLAEEYAKTEGQPWGCERHFLAGYQAGRLNSEGAQAAQPQWISVKDRLPEMFQANTHYRDSTCVLIAVVKESDQQSPIKTYVTVAHFAQFQSEKPMWTACSCSVRGNEVELNEWSFEQVSHWMPLPEAPKDK